MAEKKQKTLKQKLHAISQQVGYMEKEGKNSSQGYKFLSESQISEKFKSLLEEHKVLFSYSSKITEVRPSPTGKQIITDVIVEYKFIDVDSDEELQGTAAGQGSDATDKGVYKAITGAIKYIFMKTFLIPTGDDPENDGKKSTTSSTKSNGSYPPSFDEIPFGDEEED